MNSLEQDILSYLTERGWDRLRPSDIAKSVSIEAAELLEIFQWRNVELAEAKEDVKLLEKVREELADVMIFCLEMAALLELDVEVIVREKLAQSAAKYPAALMKNRVKSGSGSGTDSEYLRIKQEYRRNRE